MDSCLMLRWIVSYMMFLSDRIFWWKMRWNQQISSSSAKLKWRNENGQIHQAADRDASSSMNSLAPLIRMLHASHRRKCNKVSQTNVMRMFKNKIVQIDPHRSKLSQCWFNLDSMSIDFMFTHVYSLQFTLVYISLHQFTVYQRWLSNSLLNGVDTMVSWLVCTLLAVQPLMKTKSLSPTRSFTTSSALPL